MKTAPYALWIWYRGGAFRGYQRQPEGPTVQQALEEAFAALGVTATPAPSGRTDRGVHARMQVVSFRPRGGPADPAELAAALRPLLPEGMGIAAATRGLPAFHAQWSAVSKEYRYRLQLEGDPTPEWAPFVWRPELPVAPDTLARLLRSAEGTRDFIAFHEKSSVRKPRALFRAELVSRGAGRYEAILEGDGFARYMVRYLVGSSVAAAAGQLPEERLRAALDEGEGIAGTRAPAEGLMLWKVGYPAGLDPFAGLRAQLPTAAAFAGD